MKDRHAQWDGRHVSTWVDLAWKTWVVGFGFDLIPEDDMVNIGLQLGPVTFGLGFQK